MENITTSFLDLKKNATEVGELGGKLTEMWVRYMHETLMKVLSELSTGTEDGAKKAFLDAMEKAKDNSTKMVSEMCQLSSSQISNAYNIGYNEGAKMANDLNSKTMRQLIADGKLEDPYGHIEAYLKVADKVHRESLQEMMKGKNLNIYTGDIHV